MAGQSDLYIVFIYMIVYLLFTKSIHTVHPQIPMIQMVAPSQTVREARRAQRDGSGGGRVVGSFQEEATETGPQWLLAVTGSSFDKDTNQEGNISLAL